MSCSVHFLVNRTKVPEEMVELAWGFNGGGTLVQRYPDAVTWVALQQRVDNGGGKRRECGDASTAGDERIVRHER